MSAKMIISSWVVIVPEHFTDAFDDKSRSLQKSDGSEYYVAGGYRWEFNGACAH